MWQPDVTVAAICEKDGRFLVVEEQSKSTGEIVINQPAGHLEDDETIIDAVIRETREETCCHFSPRDLVGLYRLRTDAGKTYIRYTFSGKISAPDASLRLDKDIIATHWLTIEELRACHNLRSPLVLGCIEDYLKGRKFALDIIREF